MSFPRPGRALWGAMIALLAIWLMFAAALNWGGASPELFYALCGNTDRLLAGQVWRLFTAPLMHVPTGSIGHIVFTLLGLFFLAPSLEESWGGARLLRFLCFSVLFAYALQVVAQLVVPASLGAKLVPGYWFGAAPAVEAVLIAFALTFRNRTVQLFFVLPVSSRGLILFAIGLSVLMLLAGAMGPSGLVAPFGGMVAGWLFGGGTPSPLRRWWLGLRLKQLDREASRTQPGRRRRPARNSGLRVIEGGANRSRNGGSNGSGANGGRSGPGGLMH
ncbi:MAG: rhomboid family intramembrane serine protease [Polyangiaceae bacterium]|nr:rhomboid family intramembrane serine protease [Polyangiaceae bacterium]